MKKYEIVYADPPWKCDPIRTGKDKGRQFDHYKTMKTKDICKLNFNVFDDNCVLFLWATNTFLPDALKVIDSWGFKYHCCVVWNKKKGITMRGFHRTVEFLLFSYKGKFPDIWKGTPIPCLVESERLKHSEKPNIFRTMIVNKFGDLPRIELFAREKTEGWDVWGNEVDSDIDLITEAQQDAELKD